MKNYLLLIIGLSLSTVLFGQQNTFKISYGFYVSEEIKNIDVETEKDEKKKELAMAAVVAAMFQQDGKPLAQAYVNEDYIRVSSGLMQETVQVTDKKAEESYLLFPDQSQYTVSPMISDKPILWGGNDFKMLSEFGVSFVKNKEKVIAGYTCKLAQIRLNEETDSSVNVDIWYTEQIPKLYWGEYAYLEKLPGAALHIETMGIGIEATEVNKGQVDPSIFEVPEGYTLMDLVGDPEGYGTEEVAENRFTYTDTLSGLVGLMDSLDNPVTDAVYTYISYYTGQETVAADKDHKYGTIDRDGKTIIPFAYDNLGYDDHSGMYSFGKEEMYGLMDRDQKIIIPARYAYITFPIQGFSMFMQDGKYGLVDMQGKEAVAPVHSTIIENSDTHFVTLDDDDKYAIYRIADHKKLVGDGYDYLSLAGEADIFLASKDGIYGYIDQEGKVLIPFKYAYASAFVDGVATVLVSGEEDYRYLNTKGEEVQPPKQLYYAD